MEVGTILKTVRDSLRTTYTWSNNACRITINGEPLDNSPEFFVGIVDGGTDGSPDDGYYISEKFRLSVWCWRRLSQYPKDRQGNILIDEDPHLANVYLPSELERKVKLHIHMNYTLMNAINTAFSTGTSETGSGLQIPFVYQGSGATQVKAISDSGKSVEAWTGRQLRFGAALHTDPI